MKITKFKLRNFRKFREKDFQFADGINIVFGQNEQGKSTLLAGLLKVFYTDVATKSRSILQDILSWQSNTLPELRLSFRIANTEYELVRDFENKEQYISSISNKNEGRIKSAPEIKDFISQNLGMANEDILTLTALVAQNDIARIGDQRSKGKSSTNLRDGIQESLTGTANVSVENILGKLRKTISDLERGWHKPAHNFGIIKSLEIEQEDLSSQVEDARLYVDKLGLLARKSGDADKEFLDLDKKVRNLELLVSNNKKRKECEKRLNELNNLIIEKERVIQEVERIKRDIKGYEDDLKVIGLNKNVGGILEKLNKIRILKNEKDLQVESTEKEIENLRNSIQKNKKIFQIVILSSFPVLALMSLQLFRVLDSWLTFPVGITSFALMYLLARKIFLQKYLLQINEREMILENERLLIRKLEKEGRLALRSCDVSSENELKVISEKSLGIKSELGKAIASLEALTKGEALEEAKKSQAALLSEKKNLEVNELTDNIKASFIEPKEEYTKMKELEDAIKEREKAKELLMKSRLETEEKKFSYDDLVRAEEKLARVNQDLHYYKQRSQTLRLIGQFISEARGEVISSSGRIIADYMEKYLPILTNNRYHKVETSSDMEFKIFSDEKQDWVVPDETLSKGTVDQIYFLARIAILKIISKEKKPPIILDDPFATFDKERREGARKILDDLSKEHQIILLTCHEDFNSWGNLVIA